MSVFSRFVGKNLKDYVKFPAVDIRLATFYFWVGGLSFIVGFLFVLILICESS